MTTQEILVKAGQLILSLSILVVLHELGHFIPAKVFKIKVEKFCLFFDPWFSLFKFKKGDTEYAIGWLPLGGYVKIAGTVEESMLTEETTQEANGWEFRAKAAWQRLIIMAGGVIVNLIVGFMIYTMTFWIWGDTNKSIKIESPDNTHKSYTLLESIPAAANRCVRVIVKYTEDLHQIFVSKDVKIRESVGGFLSIGNMFPGTWDWKAFWERTALLSIILAFMNMLPIPALDGGHITFLLYEIVSGHKPSEKFLITAQVVGSIIVFGLLLYGNGLDLWRNVFSRWFV